jgi:NADH-quinone oxidoreductase subunit B
MSWLQNKFEKNFMITTVDYVFNWARKSALWPMTFGLACCAIEMIASSTARFDIARFGSEVFRPSPRQSDLMIVSGTVTLKMAPVVKRIYDQMPEPKWVISMGACSSVGGPFNTYAVLQGVDRVVPVDVYVIGCPPRPENLFYAMLRLQDKIDTMTLAKKPTEVRLDQSMMENFKRQVEPDVLIELSATPAFPLAADASNNSAACHQITAPRAPERQNQVSQFQARRVAKLGFPRCALGVTVIDPQDCQVRARIAPSQFPRSHLTSR